MKYFLELVYTCGNCGKTNYLFSFKKDRYKLSQEIGSELDVECRYCKKSDKINLNSVYARAKPVNSFIIFGFFNILFFIDRILEEQYFSL